MRRHNHKLCQGRSRWSSGRTSSQKGLLDIGLNSQGGGGVTSWGCLRKAWTWLSAMVWITRWWWVIGWTQSQKYFPTKLILWFHVKPKDLLKKTWKKERWKSINYYPASRNYVTEGKWSFYPVKEKIINWTSQWKKIRIYAGVGNYSGLTIISTGLQHRLVD